MSPTHYAVPRGGSAGTSLRLPDFNQEKTDMGEDSLGSKRRMMLTNPCISRQIPNGFSDPPTRLHELLGRGEDEGDDGRLGDARRRRSQDADRGGARISGPQGGEHNN